MKKELLAALLPLAFAAGMDTQGARAESRAMLAQARDLADLSLEQLTRITVTSVSKRDEKLIDAPASVFVINADDIRRSGATTLAEALRIAPNLQVARADNNQYAISARGFNNVLANKMLVLVDGRIVYSPLFSGVFWEAQDVFLEDIERIEVVSGPAATLWGANGVNGVINIRTYPAPGTRGTLVVAGAGSRESLAQARTGANLGADGAYRVYGKYWDRDHFDLASGAAIRDASKGALAGFRTDWSRALRSAALQGEAYWSDIDQAPSARKISGGHVLARWSQALEPGSEVRVQAYYDRTHRDHPGTFRESLDTFDVELQHAFQPWRSHELVWGAGYRYARDQATNSPANAFIPAHRNLHWANVFAQDEVEVARGLFVTLGLKMETNVYTGAEWLPNLRVAYHAGEHHLAWAALSRAVRAPSRIDRDFHRPGQPPYQLVGNETFASEIANVAELGYRAQVSDAVSLSATVFHHRYPNLRSVALSPQLKPAFANDIEGRLTGMEAWGTYRLLPNWRLSAGFVVMDKTLDVIAGRRDLGGMASLGTDPKHAAQLRSSWDITESHELDLVVRNSGELGTGVTPAYTVVDGRFAWRPLRSLELSIAVQNLLDRKYSEWGAAASSRALLERAFFFKLAWTPG